MNKYLAFISVVLLYAQPVLAETSSYFVRIDRTTGAIITAQTLFPPLDLTVANAALPANEIFIDITSEPARADMLKNPQNYTRVSGAWQLTPVPTPTPPLADLTGKSETLWTTSDLARALKYLLGKQGGL